MRRSVAATQYVKARLWLRGYAFGSEAAATWARKEHGLVDGEEHTVGALMRRLYVRTTREEMRRERRARYATMSLVELRRLVHGENPMAMPSYARCPFCHSDKCGAGEVFDNGLTMWHPSRCPAMVAVRRG